MENNFKQFINDIQLSETQREDAKVKYQGVIDCLAHEFYDRNRNDNDQFLFGSYKTHTNIVPMDEMQDVDVVFKIDDDTYDQYKDNPEGLMQKCKNALQKKYSTTNKIRPWIKVVLVKFAENHHNVEVVPALEQDDDTFLVPDTRDGGSWEAVDYRKQIENFNDSNSATNGLTRSLCQVLKKWIRNTTTLDYSSYELMNDVIKFLDNFYPNGKEDNRYDEIIKSFFDYKKSRVSSSDSIYSYLSTAKDRAVKAIEYENEGKHIEASEEWRKMFGDKFPKSDKNEVKESRENTFSNAPRPWFTD